MKKYRKLHKEVEEFKDKILTDIDERLIELTDEGYSSSSKGMFTGYRII